MRNRSGLGWIETPVATSKTLALTKEWDERIEKFKAQFLVRAGQYLLEQLVDNLPQNEEVSAYRSSLQLASVRSKRHQIVAVSVFPRARRVRTLDVPKTLLYVRAKGKGRVPPEVQTLERFSPWTVDTLPFTPDKKVAQVVSVQASEGDVMKVAKSRRLDRVKWRLELDKAGIKETDQDKLKVGKSVRAIPDAALLGFRLEFGTGGMKPKPHWRPAIRSMVTVGSKRILKDRAMLNALTKLGYRKWRSWPDRIYRKIRVKDVQKFGPFQKRLGIRL